MTIISDTEEKHPIAFVVEDNYAPYCATAIASICKNGNPEDSWTFLILTPGLTDENRLRLSSQVPSNCDIQIKVTAIDSYVHRLKWKICNFFCNYKTILYLDCDVVVTQSLAPLFQIDLGEFSVAAARDINCADYVRRMQLQHELYFNSGVLLLNVPFWIQHHLCEQLSQFTLMNSSRIEFIDQDSLNKVLDGKILELDFSWNLQHLKDYEGCTLLSKEALQEAQAHPKIIHYISKDKPWLPNSKQSQLAAFWNSFSQTKWFEENQEWLLSHNGASFRCIQGQCSQESIPPVLLILFNRPDLTERMIQALRLIRPSQLFIVADGPRKNRPDDVYFCAQTRKQVEFIDWQCELHIQYRSENFGCGKSVSKGVTWFFEQVSEGIILEDDCIPHPSFFRYCNILLERYRPNPSIGIISGDYFPIPTIKPSDVSYRFTLYPHIWGWATWKHTWDLFELDVNRIGVLKIQRAILKHSHSLHEILYWNNTLKRMKTHKIDTWDYPFLFKLFVHNKINIVPTKNLISNIGFDCNATHTQGPSKYANLDVFDIGEILHPDFVRIDRNLDSIHFKHVFSHPIPLWRKAKNILRIILKTALPSKKF